MAIISKKLHNMSSIQETLISAGLEPSTAQIYVILAENGELPVAEIIAKSQLSRAGTYDAINLLIAKELIEYRKEGRNAFYKAAHPNKLFGLIEQKKRENDLFSREMESAIRSLTGSFNLSNNRPGVRFFEGEEGVKEALFDSLGSSEPILTFMDMQSMETVIGKINEEYVKERIKRSIVKKLLITDSPEARAYLDKNKGNTLTQIALLPPNIQPFKTGFQIYENKIVYFTHRHDNLLAIMIQDQDICQMNKSIFEHLWVTHHQEEKNIPA